MVEKKQIVYDLRLSYDGPLSIEGFYEEVEKWMEENGMQKEIKRKSEDVSSKGKNVEWIIETWNEATHLVKRMVRIRALFNNVKEIKIKRKGHIKKINRADALIFIDGFVETKLSHQVTMNPLYSFFRTLFAKFIWDIGQTETERYEAPVRDYCYDLHKRLKTYFSLYKAKVG